MTRLLLNGHTVDLRIGSVTDAAGQVATLRPQSAEVLKILAAQPGVLVTKDELMQAVWPGIAVTDDSLVQCIKEIRQAIGDGKHQVITTVVKRGYVLHIETASQDAMLTTSAKGPEGTTGVPPRMPEQLPLNRRPSLCEPEF
jgi:DNA-binding winged helix-turn-helix (wHTH) protein